MTTYAKSLWDWHILKSLVFNETEHDSEDVAMLSLLPNGETKSK